MTDKFDYRLGLDVGTNSLGWSVLKLENNAPARIVAAGSRIFSDGRDDKSNATLKATRREKRSARRRRDRFKQRQLSLLGELIQAGLFPSDEQAQKALQKLNPLKLRANALTKKLPPYQIGRALFHLNQRRGFKSSRVEIRDGAVSKSIDQLKESLEKEGSRTVGEYLWELYSKHEQTRARPRNKKGEAESDSNSKKVDHYDHYPDRKLLEDEFRTIWEKQQGYYATANDKFKDLLADDRFKEKIRGIIFDQRPLRAQEIGMCMYMSEHRRGAKALPSLEHHRIYQTLNHLSWQQDGDSIFLRDCHEGYKAIEKMLTKPTNQEGKVTYKKILEALTKIGVVDSSARFNLQRQEEKYLFGDKTAAVMGGGKSPVKDRWNNKWSLDEKDRFIETIGGRVPDEQNPGKDRIQTDEEVKSLLEQEYKLTPEDAQACIDLELQPGYANLSKQAARYITAEMMRDEKPPQRKAVQNVAKKIEGFKDPDELKGPGDKTQLFYYGQVFEGTNHIIPGSRKEVDKDDDFKYWGGITNPSIHIALNQIRWVVNEIIKVYGRGVPPSSISIELGRNLPAGKKKRSEEVKKNKERRKANEADKKELREMFGIKQPSNDDIRKLRLWKEAKKSCPFCPRNNPTRNIGCADLVNSAQIEHLIPKAYGGDDNWANLTVACRKCNQEKGGRTPYEAFGDNPDYSNLPEYKHWRFQEDAKELWEKKYKGFLARHINDTRYIGKIAKAYLGEICKDSRITVVTGKLTYELRQYWKLDSILDHPGRPEDERGTKNRNDHRHHAVDAIAIGMATRSLVKKVSYLKERGGLLLMDKLIGQSKEEKEGFLNDAKNVVDTIIVSHKVSRKKPRYKRDEDGNYVLGKKSGKLIPLSTDGQLHNDTAFGIVSGPNEKEEYETVVRRSIDYFLIKPETIAKRLKDIRDPHLQKEFLDTFEQDGKAGVKKLAGKKGIRHLRCFGPKDVIPIADKSGKVYKTYQGDSNWGMEIYAYPDTHPKADKWEGVVISRFNANKADFKPGHTYKPRDKKGRPYPTARLVMRLQVNDCVQVEEGGQKRIMRLQKMSQGGQLAFAPHNEANVDARNRANDEVDPFKYLYKTANALKFLNARKVHLSPSGRVSYENRKPRRKR